MFQTKKIEKHFYNRFLYLYEFFFFFNFLMQYDIVLKTEKKLKFLHLLAPFFENEIHRQKGMETFFFLFLQKRLILQLDFYFEWLRFCCHCLAKMSFKNA